MVPPSRVKVTSVEANVRSRLCVVAVVICTVPVNMVLEKSQGP